MNDRAYAQITVRLEFARLLKALFETEDYKYVELSERGLFYLSDPAAYLGEIPPVQDFLASHAIAYDLTWGDGQHFDRGVRQVRFLGPKAEMTEKWIFPWDGLVSARMVLDELSKVKANSRALEGLLEQLADEARSSDLLQPLCSIPLTDQQRRLAERYDVFACLATETRAERCAPRAAACRTLINDLRNQIL